MTVTVQRPFAKAPAADFLPLVCGFVPGASLGTSNGVFWNLANESALVTTRSNDVAPNVGKAVMAPPVIRQVPTAAITNAERLGKIHAESGLTWEQIAKLFTVSRRSVHLWLSGGRMSARNEEHLVALERFVSSINAAPDVRRHRILAVSVEGVSFFDAGRRINASTDGDINRSLEPLVQEE